MEREYARQGKAARGLVRRYMEKITGLSRAQVTRLIALYKVSGRVQPPVYQRRRFPQRYTRAGIERLAAVDEAHETLSAPSATADLTSISILKGALPGSTDLRSL